jgi:hypothetical protein
MAGISSISMSFTGANYLSVPTVTVSDPDLSASTATGSVTLNDSNIISGITISDGGAFYTSAPEVTVSFTDSNGQEGGIIVGSSINIDGTVTSVDIPVYNVPIVSSSVVFDSATGTDSDFRATLTAVFDSDTSTITNLIITDSGGGYTSDPTITIAAPYTNLNYEVGDLAQQFNPTFNMVGEIQGYNDSSRELTVIRVGASDGKFHEWNTTNPIVGLNTGASGSVLSVREVQTEPDAGGGTSGNVTDFDVSALEFIDFSETNPFGDP